MPERAAIGRNLSRRALLAGAPAALAACSSAPLAPDLELIYSRAATLDSPERRPVVTIPGTLGSRLRDRASDRLIWAGPSGLSVDPADDANLRALALPVGAGDEALFDLRDDVRPDGVARRLRSSILGGMFERDIYAGIISTLIKGGYDFRETRAAEIAERAVNLDAFEFPYDWRRDIVEAARDLAWFLRRKREQVAAERRAVFGEASGPVMFDLVAHSMGALVARYFLMYGDADLPEDGSPPELTWAGAREVGCAILIAPPNAGSPLAFVTLVEGVRYAAFEPFFPPALVGTHVSPYQLMPRVRHARVREGGLDGPAIDIYDPEQWARRGWGLADPAQADVLARLLPDEPDAGRRRDRALGHIAKCLRRAQALHRALDRPSTFPRGLDAHLVAGGAHPTPAVATVDAATGRARVAAMEEGDEVVLRASALLDERIGPDAETGLRLRSPIGGLRSTLLLPYEHVEITSSAVFGDNLLFWLLQGARSAEIAPDGG